MNATAPGLTASSRTRADTLICGMDLKTMESSLLARALLLGAKRNNLTVAAFEGAISFAAYVHRNDTRAQRAGLPRTHYLEHPLRVTERLARYGCVNEDVLISAILHDTVEDHAAEIVADFMPDAPSTNARDHAIDYVSHMFGRQVGRNVLALSNPDMDPTLSRDEKHALYREHVTEAIEHPQVALVKFSDFVDNAFSLKHTISPATEGMVTRLAAKYSPLVDVFAGRMSLPDIAELVSPAGLTQMRAHITGGRAMLTTIISSTK